MSTTTTAPTRSAKYLLTSKSPAITVSPIDFNQTPLGALYGGLDAVVLDNVLTKSECDEILAAAETVGDWERAMVNVGNGRQALYTDIRNCGRIIWDDREIVDRILQRVAPHIKDFLSIEGKADITGNGPVKRKEVWAATRLNERMRFLKYVGGEYFKPHRDGSYETPDKLERSYYTLHLYLNDETNPAPGDKPLKGGATTFQSYSRKEKLDVSPKIGRVLIFQHQGLLHSGDDVVQGTKYTMRTDIMYKLVSRDGKSVE